MKRVLFSSFLIFLGIWTSHAQCFPDRHSTTWYDGWISCETSPNPITSYGETHWIRYDFGFVYEFYKSTIWNNNEPSQLNNGVQDYLIDYSIDGISWTNLGSYTLAQATGKSNYQGEEGPDFNGVSARYVVLTPISNYGGSCYGISEIKINIDENLNTIDQEIGFSALAYPNPFTNELNIQFKTRNTNAKIKYTFYDILGRSIYSKTIENTANTTTIQLSNTDLQLVAGIYFLKLEQNGQQQTLKVIKE